MMFRIECEEMWHDILFEMSRDIRYGYDGSGRKSILTFDGFIIAPPLSQ